MIARALLAALCATVALPALAQPVAIIHARAWTGTADAPIEDATILIEDGRIRSIEAGSPAPSGATVIDAAGRPVTAGLFNAATQVGLTEAVAARDIAATGRIVGASFDVSYGLNGNSTLVSLARTDGITRALSYPSPSPVAPFSGQAATVRLREGVDILDRPRAALFAVIGDGEWSKDAGARGAQWQMLRIALDNAGQERGGEPDRKGKGGGGDRPGGDRPGGDRPGGGKRGGKPADLAIVDHVLDGTMPLAIVTNRESDIRQAIALAADYKIRVVIVGGAEAWRAADALAAANIPVILDPEANLPNSFDQLGARQDSAAILARAGVRLAFGMIGNSISLSLNAGSEMRQSAGIAVANGLPYADALKAITANPAAIWLGTAGTGTIAAGADADLVLWDGDPLEPSTNALAVIIEGKPVSIDNRQIALEKRYAPGTGQR